jgi:Domain of unknown function (DUF4352)
MPDPGQPEQASGVNPPTQPPSYLPPSQTQSPQPPQTQSPWSVPSHWPAPPMPAAPSDSTSQASVTSPPAPLSASASPSAQTPTPAGTLPFPSPAAAAQPGAPPPPTQRHTSVLRRHLALFVTLAVVTAIVLCLGGAIAAIIVGHKIFSDRTDHPMVAMGQPVQDGNFMFTVSKMQCGVHQLGTPDDYQTPTGQFCIIELKIANVGKEPGIYADSIQDAFAPNGSRYSADTPAGYYANADPLIFLNEINPGNHIDVSIVYDIPNGGSISRLELHENPNTNGAIIKMHS